MPKFVALYRVVFNEPTEVQANVAIETLAMDIERRLDEVEGEQVKLIEFVEYGSPEAKTGLIEKSRSLRNDLIRTKGKNAWEIAQALDMYIHFLSNPTYDEGDEHIQRAYDYGHIMDVAEQVWAGKNPTD